MNFSEIVRHATSLRHELHRHPEKTWEERDTAARIRRELERLEVPYRTCAETGTVAELGNGHASRIALRADIDALPIRELTARPYASVTEGVMHACGHDGHAASLLATVAWFKQHEDTLPVGVRFLFQPAEEGGHGAKRMIEDGCLEGVEQIYGYHNLPTMPFGCYAAPGGSVMVSNGHFQVKLRGSGGHAATPEVCRDALLAGAQFATLAQQIVARNVAPQVAAVITITTFHCGTARNVIADEAVLTGTIRAEKTELRQELADRLEEVLQGVCVAVGVTADFAFEPAYEATVNHPGPARRLRQALALEFGTGRESQQGVPFMGGEDFSYYLQKVPGAYALIGSGRSERDPPLHSPHYDFNDALIASVVRTWSHLVGIAAQ